MTANFLRMAGFQKLMRDVIEWLKTPLFHIGDSAITAGTLLIALVSLFLLYWLAALARRLTVRALR